MRVGWQVENCAGHQLDDELHDVLHRDDADRPVPLVDERDVAVAAHVHQVERPDDAIVGPQRLRVARHEIAHAAFGPVELLARDAVEQIALGEDSLERSAGSGDKDATDVVFLQVLDRLLQRRILLHGDGRTEAERADQLAFQ